MKAMKRMKRGAGPLARRAVALVLALAMALVGLAAPLATVTAYASSSSSSVISDASEGVVRVFCIYTVSGYDEATSNSNGTYTYDPTSSTVGYAWGTGFGIGETAGEATDTFVTNRHVVTNDDYDISEIWILLDDDAVTITENYSVVTDADGNYIDSYPSSIDIEVDETKAVRADILYVSEDEDPDVAIIQARSEVSGRVALALQDEDVSAGDGVWALGYPGDSEDMSTSYEEVDTGYKYTLSGSIDDITVTSGIISRIVELDAHGGNTYIQHAASISSGNSGGPLVDENGAVIGINTLIHTGDTDTDYYALDIDYVIEVCEAEGIPYATYSDDIPVVLIAGIAVAVVAVVAVVVVLLSRKKAAAPVAATAGEPAPAPAPAPAPVTAPAPVPVASPAIANDSGFRIQGQSGVFAGRRFAIAGQLRLGRDPSKNDLVFPGDTKGISGVHCVLGVDGAGQVTLMDLGSTYGTYLAQGQRLAAHQPLTLKPGDVFYLGSTDQQFVLVRKGGQ